MQDGFQNFDYSTPILQNFRDYSVGFIALHPFYKRVFHNTYSYLDKLELTYPLIERVTWQTVANDIGFKRLETLAAALTHNNESHYKELRDYVEHKNLEFPLVAEDTIPVEVLVPVLRASVQAEAAYVLRSCSKHTVFDNERVNVRYEINEKNIFDVAPDLMYCFLVQIPELSIALLLPERDSPYTLILAQREEQKDFIAKLQLDGFFIDKKSRFDWWNQEHL
jgi:hypothetical protein